METKTITLFGVKIYVARNNDEENRVQETDHIHDGTDHVFSVDTSLGLCTGSSSSAVISRKDDQETHAAVDTSLGLCTGNPNSSRKDVQEKLDDKYEVVSHVDTWLGLCTGSPCSDVSTISDDKNKGKLSKKRPFQEMDYTISFHGSEYNIAVPLRWFHPTIVGFSSQENMALGSREKPKERKMKSVKRSKGGEDQKPPILPLEEIPGLLQSIEGTKPVFLYKKELEESDVKADQNRLFVSGNHEKLMEFLNVEERRAVDESSKGIEFFGIDRNGKSYKLHLGKWKSLEMVVLKKEWRKLICANNVEKGHWVELWGYRQNTQLRFVTIFRKPQEPHDQDNIA